MLAGIFATAYCLTYAGKFGQPLIAYTEMIKLVAYIGLGEVNNVFSHVSLILVATFIF